MNISKYISKQLIVRICLLLVVVGGAAIFDIYHAANQQLADSIRKIPTHDEAGNGKTFYCNQLPTFNLKTAATEFSLRFGVASSHDKFLLKYYNLRTFQFMKAEALNAAHPFVCSFHSLPFNRVIYSSPDDTPPLS